VPGQTTNEQYPYPLGSDPIDIAGDIQRLAEKLDSHNFAANMREILLAQGPAFSGWQYINIQTGHGVTMTSAQGAIPISFTTPFTAQPIFLCQNGDANSAVHMLPWDVQPNFAQIVTRYNDSWAPVANGTVRWSYVAIGTRYPF